MQACALSRLGPKSLSLKPVVGFSSLPYELNSVEFSAILSGLTGHVEDFARAKYTGDQQALCSLRNHAREYAKEVAVRDKWKCPKDEGSIPANMGDLASIEAVGAVLCIGCHTIVLSGSRCQCGNTNISINSYRRAILIGVNPTNYGRNWMDRYEQIYRYITYFDDEVHRQINRQ